MNTQRDNLLYIWLDGEPAVTPADVEIENTPGVSDLDQLTDAIIAGRLGRYLPVTLHFAANPRPTPGRVRAVDVAKLLRDRHIRHRRRYEVILEAIQRDQ